MHNDIPVSGFESNLLKPPCQQLLHPDLDRVVASMETVGDYEPDALIASFRHCKIRGNFHRPIHTH